MPSNKHKQRIGFDATKKIIPSDEAWRAKFFNYITKPYRTRLHVVLSPLLRAPRRKNTTAESLSDSFSRCSSSFIPSFFYLFSLSRFLLIILNSRIARKTVLLLDYGFLLIFNLLSGMRAYFYCYSFSG